MTVEPLYVATSVMERIVAHAQAGKPEEVCGILRGQDNRAWELVQGQNVAPDPCQDYEVDTRTLLRQFEFEEQGDEMVAIYQSHPVSPAYPSASDAWNAHYPDCAYIICSLEQPERVAVRAYQLLPHDVPLDVSALRAGLALEETRPGRFAHFQAAQAPLPEVLQGCCDALPRPFYVVFESLEIGEDFPVRVVSVAERDIATIPDEGHSEIP
jgi:proteasome lid subunit RPN8/RPN11